MRRLCHLLIRPRANLPEVREQKKGLVGALAIAGVGFSMDFIENPMKLTNHPFNILVLEVTVFHRPNDVTPRQALLLHRSVNIISKVKSFPFRFSLFKK